MESDELAIFIPSVIICITGTLTNSLSLAFFLNKDDGTLVTRIFIMLNSFDLAVCITATVYVVQLPLNYAGLYEGIYSGHYFFDVFSVLYWTAVAATAFATTTLSVTRAIFLYRPFYRANGRALVVATITFLTYFLAKEVTYPIVKYLTDADEKVMHQHMTYNHCLYAFNIGTPIVTVMISNFLSVLKLVQKKDGERRLTEMTRKATITVIIISVLFCFFNLLSVIGTFLFSTGLTEESSTVKLASTLALWIVIPLNSALNPLVYFFRKRAMREYGRELGQKVRGCGCNLR